MRGPSGIRTRVTWVVAVVAGLVVIITGVIMIPFARSAARDEARDRLAAQVEVVARLDGAGASPDLDRVGTITGSDGALFATVDENGDASGKAASYATAAGRAALAAGRGYSGGALGADGAALVEARPAGTGGAGVVGALPVSEVERVQWRATWRILIALVLGLAITLVAGALLAGSLARPLVATTRAARRLAAGERGVAVPTTGPGEVREVAAALTALDAALAKSEDRQREFLLSISHELRTPLSALRGYGEALADGLIPPAQTAAVGATLVAESDRLDLFVRDLLALARLETDEFSLEVADVDLAVVAREAVAAWDGRAAKLGVGLTVATAREVAVRTDPRRVRQVLDGLIENALRATPEGGAVTVTTSADAAAVGLEVADTGPGLAPDDLAVAFDRGALRARYRDTRAVGTGLGLSIAARLVERLGGEISVRSAPGAGAVFAVRLPGAPPERARRPEPDAQPSA